MKKRKGIPSLTLVEIEKAQEAANNYAREYFTKHPLGFSALPEEAFKKASGLVLRALFEAYAAGYMARQKELEVDEG